jgi:hypothetical protein
MIKEMFRPVVGGNVQVNPMTVDEYHQLIKAGKLPEDTSIELIHGFLRRKNRAAAGEDPMTVGHLHVVVVQKLMRFAPLIERHGCHLQIQQPIALPPDSEPEPDGSIIVGSVEDHSDIPRARDVLCVIEAADSSLRDDRGWKLELYAAAGIAMYVIVNIPERVVEVYTNPVRTAQRYRKSLTLRSGESLRLPIGKDKSVEIPVEKILP